MFHSRHNRGVLTDMEARDMPPERLGEFEESTQQLGRERSGNAHLRSCQFEWGGNLKRRLPSEDWYTNTCRCLRCGRRGGILGRIAERFGSFQRVGLKDCGLQHGAIELAPRVSSCHHGTWRMESVERVWLLVLSH